MRSPLDRVDPLTDQPAEPDQVHQAPFQVGETLPAVMRVPDMCRVFTLTRSGFHRGERKGWYQRFELTRTTGPKRWSGKLVQAFLGGEDRIFGRARLAGRGR